MAWQRLVCLDARVRAKEHCANLVVYTERESLKRLRGRLATDWHD